MAGDIRAYALAGHPPCGGRGYTVAGGAAVPCKCATKRFLAANPRVILDDAGGAWWPAEIPPGGDQ